MNNSRWWLGLTLCIFVLASTSVLAQDEPVTDDPATDAPATDDRATDEAAADPEIEALKELKIAYEEACNSGDPAKLKPYIDPDFTGVMITQDTVESYDDIEAFWEKVEGYLGEGGKYSVKVNLAQDALTDGNYALAFGTTDDSAVTSGGTQVNFQTKWTAVCRKNDAGEWKIWRIHGSMNPFDNPFTTATSGIALFMTAAVAGLIGLVLGFVGAGMMSGRG